MLQNPAVKFGSDGACADLPTIRSRSKITNTCVIILLMIFRSLTRLYRNRSGSCRLSWDKTSESVTISRLIVHKHFFYCNSVMICFLKLKNELKYERKFNYFFIHKIFRQAISLQ